MRILATALAGALVLTGTLCGPLALALDSSWTSSRGGDWSTGSNWSTNPSYPNGIGDTARLTRDISTETTVYIDPAIPGDGVTLGALYLSDNDKRWIVKGADGKSLILDAATGNAKVQADGADTWQYVDVPVVLRDNLTVTANCEALFFTKIVSSGVSGTGITKTGPGEFWLDAANTYSGPTTVSQGTLVVYDPEALGAVTAGTTVAAGASVRIYGSDMDAINEPLIISGMGVGNQGALFSTGDGDTWAGQVRLAADAAIGADTWDDLTVTGDVVGPRSLTKVGGGIVTLSGTKTFGGSGRTVTISDGTLSVASDSCLGNPANTITLAGGALQTHGTWSLDRPVILSGTGGALDVYYGELTPNRPVSGAGGLTKKGGGTLILPIANSYEGPTVVELGVLKVAHPGALGTSGSGTAISDGAALELAGGMTVSGETVQLGQNYPAGSLRSTSGDNAWLGGVSVPHIGDVAVDSGSLTVVGPITGTASSRLSKYGAGTLNLTPTEPYPGMLIAAGGTLHLAAAMSVGGSTTVRNGGTLDLGAGDLVTSTLLLEDGSVTSAGGVLRATGDFELCSGSVHAPIAGPGNLKKTKAGTVVFACPAGYDGYTRIEGGTLRLGASDVLPDGTSLILSAAGGYSTLFDLDGHNETIARLSGTVGPVTLGSGTLTLAPSVSSTSSYSGSITGTGGLIMAGTQSQRLFGHLSYTGPTVIESGTLIFGSSTTLASSVLDIRPDGVLQVSATTPFVLKPGQRLEGTGRVVNGLTVQGAVAPGSSAGILTVGNITFADGSVLEIELDGTEKGLQYDVLSSSGTITLQPGSTLEVVLGGGFAPAPGDTFDVLDFVGLAGAFGDLHMPDPGPGRSWDTGALYTQGAVQVVPEPATLGLLAVGVTAALGVARGRGAGRTRNAAS